VLTTFKSDLRKVLDYPYRNMVAHEPFESHMNGGVAFLRVKAKGSYSRPREVWSTERFAEEGRKISEFAANVAKLRQRLASLTFHLDALELAGYYGMPMQRTMSPTLADHLSRQPLNDPDSNPDLAIPKTSSQTPDKTQESE
jgi:hypothetical protein